VQGTTADVKNNLLFEKFNINYNNLPQIFRKGSIVYRKQVRVLLDAPILTKACHLLSFFKNKNLGKKHGAVDGKLSFDKIESILLCKVLLFQT
jgi:tRNA(His) 5'-end guanylyltransferase